MLTANRDATVLERAMGLLLLLGGMLVCASVTWNFSQGINQRGVAMLVAAILVVICLVAPVIGISLTFIWLAILGDVRRLFIFETGIVDNDPLLMVGPAAAIAIAIMPFLHGKYDFNGRLPRLIFILMLLMLVEVANPIQGGLMIGLAGGMFYLIPLVWFWIGQEYGTEENFKIFFGRVIVIIGVVACALAMWQTFVGFLPYQEEWVRIMKTKFLALNIGGKVRPFAFFVSPAEYAHYLVVVVMIALAPLVRAKLRPVVFLIPLAIACILFQGGRGPLVLVAIGGIAMWALAAQRLNGQTVLTRVAIGMGIAVAAVVFGLGAVGAAGDLGDILSPSLQRQASGLLNPLDQKESTLIDHLLIALNGVIIGFRNPMGMGLGASTMAGAKFTDGEDGIATEMDVSNMFVSLGFVGGFLYVGIIAYIFWRNWKLIWKTQAMSSIIIFGILLSQFSQWLNGQHYAVSALVWFCVGMLDRQQKDLDQEEAAALA